MSSALDNILRPSIPELGKIKIGGLGDIKRSRGGQGKEYRMPRKDDHFTVTTLHREPSQGDVRGNLIPDSDLMEKLVAKYGDADGLLREIPISVLSDSIDEIMQVSYVYYSGKKIIARSDGKTVEWFYDEKTGERLDKPFICDWDERHANLSNNYGKLFKLFGVFNCVITSEDARWGGVYKFRTTSRISAEQLYGSLLTTQGLTNGILSGLPLRLIVRPMEVNPDGKSTIVHVVHVELRGQDIQAIQNQARELLTAKVSNATAIEHGRQQYQKLLVAPGYEKDPEEIAAISDEFAPEIDVEDTEPLPPEDGDAAVDELLGNVVDAVPEDAVVEPEIEEPDPEPAAKDDGEMTPDEHFEDEVNLLWESCEKHAAEIGCWPGDVLRFLTRTPDGKKAGVHTTTPFLKNPENAKPVVTRCNRAFLYKTGLPDAAQIENMKAAMEAGK